MPPVRRDRRETGIERDGATNRVAVLGRLVPSWRAVCGRNKRAPVPRAGGADPKVTNVSSTGDGVYMTYEVTTSVRFRIMEITGDYPRSDADVFVSAVFID